MIGRAKFGVSDDGKELFQLAQAKAVEAGDWRSDYYRGHTLLLATGQAKPEDILAQLYADASNDPFSKGRQMSNHHATPYLDERGNFKNQLEALNVSSATSPTAGQMARGLGLAFASKVYREATQLDGKGFSDNGNEICWTSIGDASTSEGVFWETMNAAGVIEAPLVVTVADDGYGISVPVKYQTTKASISAALAGLEVEEGTNGIRILKEKGWNYAELCQIYAEAARIAREEHRAVLVHVHELTQPNGHSTSGSHERYKNEERMKFEQEFDCMRQFRFWILSQGIAEATDLDKIEKTAKQDLKIARDLAWERFVTPRRTRRDELVQLIQSFLTSHSGDQNSGGSEVFAHCEAAAKEISRLQQPVQSELVDAARRLRHRLAGHPFPDLDVWIQEKRDELVDLMGRHLLSETADSPILAGEIAPAYAEELEQQNGYEILQDFFKQKFASLDTLYAFGEDVGNIGDVNQGFAGVQDEFGEHRIFDTGIREWTILGQAQGMAMRGLRPIVEIQYLDYVYYALPQLTDDVATLRWRTAGMQSCPLIVRTRGHRLEGIWHSGSYIAPLIGSLRGMHLCVPRNMVQAIGMYNTLLDGDDPGLVIEVLNGYRLKERIPHNLTELKVPLGVPEVVREGDDLTIVTYGACVKVCNEAAELLAQRGVEVEVIDVQTLLPFDLEHRIAQQLRHTNRLMIVDEDVPGGASAYLLQQITEQQGGFLQLDAPVKTVTAPAHRPAYADDGNYVSKPQVMDVVDAAMEVVMF
ncbi:transketolase [Lewinellaceae bacterium SD302]|nr:transketolase [Lewinellaceae bacterium SD302]